MDGLALDTLPDVLRGRSMLPPLPVIELADIGYAWMTDAILLIGGAVALVSVVIAARSGIFRNGPSPH